AGHAARAPPRRRRHRHRARSDALRDVIVRMSRPTFRGTELGLLVPVALLAALGSIAVVGAQATQLPVAAFAVPIVFVLVALALHVFLVITGFRGDQLLLPLALGLVALGLVM